jgi:hypothetical protein
MDYLKKLQQETESLRQEIINHKVYKAIKSIDDLTVFMRFHVYAVWDFMSLLKALQNNLTCTRVPWFPVGDGEIRYLINEIVVDEEADTDRHGNRKSHFEMYLEAMENAGSSTKDIVSFIDALKANSSFDKSYQIAQTPQAAKNMVNNTFSVVNTAKPHLQAAVFTFGREDLIPAMFLSIINDIKGNDAAKMEDFIYYLERHIEVDGGHHSHLALKMTTDLCGDDATKWEEAIEAVKTSLQCRIGLWDGVYEELMN